MASCKGHVCKLILYKVTNVKVEGLPAQPGAGSGPRCTALKNTAAGRRKIADLVKNAVENSPDPVVEDLCPEDCFCVQAGPAQFGPPSSMEWTATVVVTRGQAVCRYEVKGTYDKAAAVVDGFCTDGKDDLGELKYISFDWGEGDDPVALKR